MADAIATNRSLGGLSGWPFQVENELAPKQILQDIRICGKEIKLCRLYITCKTLRYVNIHLYG